MGTGDLEDLRPLLPHSWEQHGPHASLGGCDLRDLATAYGTPLYIYDEPTIRGAVRRAREALAPLDASLAYAAKACSTPGILQILASEGLRLDAVSAGEVEAGLRAGFEPHRIYLHGNCKTDAELELAVRLPLSAVVLDDLEEVSRLEAAGAAAGSSISVLLRLALPFEADTHPAIQTSGYASKFGIQYDSREEEETLSLLRDSSRLRLVGLHTHLGSQIADAEIYARALRFLSVLAERLLEVGMPIEEINIGGGWAVPYVPGAPELRSETVAAAVAGALPRERSWSLTAEVGRSLVARAGVALYRVGSVKRRGGRRLIAVDGGMGDNPRPALYGSPYTALAPGHLGEPPSDGAEIVGRYCESGDVLVRDAALPEVAAGDLLLIPVSGAYHLSMSSTYNGVPQPAVVLVGNGRHHLLTRRGTPDDLFAREMPIPGEGRGSGQR